MIRIYYKKAKDEESVLLNDPKEGCWIHVDEATSTDLAEISRWTSIEYLDLQDCLDKYELPRIERINNHILTFTRFPSDQEIGLYTSTLTIILSQHYFITIAPQRCLFIQQFLEQKNKYATNQHNKLLTMLFLKLNQEFTAQIRKVRYTVLSAEKEMINVESEDITTLTKNEENLNQYLSSLMPIRNVLEGMTSGKFIHLHEKEKELMEDLLNSVKQSEELCSIVLKSIRSLRDSYQIIFANNLHKTIKLLTALTIILNIPTMIASIYGMNIELPLAKSTFAFMLVMSVTIVISIIAFWLFRRKKWL